MKDRTKEVLRDGFGSLINNACALRGAKNGPLWLTIIFFILALLLPVIPLFVAQANTNGTSFLGSNTYFLEKYVPSVGMDLKNRNVEFEISSNHLMSVSENGNPVDMAAYSSKPFAGYINVATGQYDFVLYLSDETNKDDRNATIALIGGIYYTNNTTTVAESSEKAYHPSYMILFKNSVHVAIYNGTKQITYSLGGDYESLEPGNTYLAKLLEVKDGDGNVIAPSMFNDEYTNGVLNNYKKFIDKTYAKLKIQNMFGTSGIYLAIYFGVNVLMGFLMWLLTRGKNNPNNYFSPWLTMKAQARLALSPALIAFIAGWFLTQYIVMIYIMLLGLRVMWMSMKELRPIQQ